MTPYAKGAAYMGLALITPASGWICYKIGQFLDRQWSTSWVALAGLLIGCAAGMYETYREGLRIEGITSLISKAPPSGTPNSKTPKDDASKPE